MAHGELPSNIFNPFQKVRYNSDIKPHSRTMHTTLWQKTKDTYIAFKGDEDQFGLIDYGTLFAFGFVAWLNKKAKNIMEEKLHLDRQGSKKVGVYIVRALFFIPWLMARVLDTLINNCLRPALAFVLTGVFWPAVLVSHVIANAVKYRKAKNAAKEIKFNEIDEDVLVDNTRLEYRSTDNKIAALIKKTPLCNVTVQKFNCGEAATEIIGNNHVLQLFAAQPKGENIRIVGLFAPGKQLDRLMEVNESARVAIEGESGRESFVPYSRLDSRL